MCKRICNGPQTLKSVHEEVELWIPILLWFKDIRQALPTISIPYGQTNLDIKLSSVAKIAAAADYGGGGAFTGPDIVECDLFVNHIFVNPEVYDIYLKRIGVNLIRVHRRHTQELSLTTENVLLSELKWATESLFVCVRPKENEESIDFWHECSVLEKKEIPTPVIIDQNQLAFNQCLYNDMSPSVDTFTLTAHNIVLYSETAVSFFNSYIPYRYGELLSTPEDPGSFMINFNFYPGRFQPSGHINISRSRELYLRYTSSFINQNNMQLCM